MVRLITFLVLFIVSHSVFSQNTTTSILSEGTVFKMTLPQTGIYRLTFQDLQDNTDLDVNAIDPRNIRIYGNPGGHLPLDNDLVRYDDVVENPIHVQGEEDGSFDSGDYILFYAEGADRLITDANTGLNYEKNIYDRNNYYFLKVVNGGNAKRIKVKSSISTASHTEHSDKLIRHEVDETNLLGAFGSTQGSGKQWFGETFTGDRDQSFGQFFNLQDYLPGSIAQIEALFVARSENLSDVTLNFAGRTFTERIGASNIGEIESIYAREALFQEEVLLSTANPNVDLSYVTTTPDSKAWLDYIQLKYKQLSSVPASGFISLIDTESPARMTSGFRVSGNPEDLQIWDVTDLDAVSAVNYDNENTALSFGYEPGGKLRHFVAFKEATANLKPANFVKVDNQNVHGVERADLIIIYHPDFLEAAEKLAGHRAQHDAMTVKLINIFEVYNEFAGGKADPVAIRDMARMLHQRDDRFRYMILLGDASYDYRGIVPNLDYQNFVPTYQTDESLDPILGFPSDDFFGLLSDEEGGERMSGKLDIGIGRIPARDLDQALAVVDKIVSYDSGPDRYGEWRTNIGFAADDADTTSDRIHARDTDNIAKTTAENHPCLLQKKTYFDAFVQESTPGGARYPEANQAITDNINKGLLAFVYLGHGGPKGLSQERVIQISDVRNYSNRNRLPVFVTATCSFTGFDEPAFVSAGEHLINNPNGGAVAMFTTVRSVYASSNEKLTREIYNSIFDRENGLPLRLGDILIKGKNFASGASVSNTRKFLLMGDPSMRIALPEDNIKITEFNGRLVDTSSVDTLGALGTARFKGHIEGFADQQVRTGFNGKIFITVFDKPTELKTLTNDNKGAPIPFTVKKNVLYKGIATVTNGEFEVAFIIPQDIDFEFGPGSIHLYATDENTTDAIGCYEKIVIGGSSGVAIDDNEGPEIDIFFNDRSFTIGGQTNDQPLLIVDLADENGINLSSTSIGHDITATLEDRNGDRIVLNEFYEPTIDKVGSGTVSYQMPQLEPGFHKIYLKAWDILNNSSEEMSEFMVVDPGEGFLDRVYNYPNPFSTNTQFTFEHDLVNTDLDIAIGIYTISGKLVKTIIENRYSQGSRLSDIYWDGRDDYGNKLAKGIYLYKINLSAPQLNLSRESDFQKLSILH